MNPRGWKLRPKLPRGFSRSGSDHGVSGQGDHRDVVFLFPIRSHELGVGIEGGSDEIAIGAAEGLAKPVVPSCRPRVVRLGETITGQHQAVAGGEVSRDLA